MVKISSRINCFNETICHSILSSKRWLLAYTKENGRYLNNCWTLFPLLVKHTAAVSITTYHSVIYADVVTPTNTTLGTRNFAVAGTKIWNCLPADLWLHSHSQSLQSITHLWAMSPSEDFVKSYYINARIIIIIKLKIGYSVFTYLAPEFSQSVAK